MNAAFRAYLTTHGVTQDVRGALEQQGITTFNILRENSHADIKELCARMLRPGGEVIVPAAEGGGTRTDPGVAVSWHTTKTLRNLAFGLRVLQTSQRDFNANDHNDAWLVKMGAFYEEVTKKRTENTPPSKLVKSDQIREKLESFENYCYKQRGSIAKLAYLLRSVEAPADDPADGYATMDEELVARARFSGAHYDADNEQLFFDMMDTFGGTVAEPYMKPHQRRKNGRLAWRGVYDHFMSKSSRSTIVLEAESTLKNLKYTSEARCSFQSYVSRQVNYEVELPDGRVKDYSANVLAEHIFTQVDHTGHRLLVLKELIDHKSDGDAVKQEDKYVTAADGSLYQGRQQLRKTTKGWWLLVRWTDGTESWEKLSDLKESFPLQTAEYAVANQISKEPAFEWWVEQFIKDRQRLIKKVKTRVAKKTHKFGLELPASIQQAIAIDERTGSTMWRDAIAKEMKNVSPAFKILDEDAPDPVGHQQIRCHMIFDIKLDLTRKARFVAGGHVTETLASLTYQSVVSRESVRIAFTIAALNDLDVCAADIQNAYITAPCKEKIWTRCGPEFGASLQGRKAVIVRALYGLKSAARAFGSFLAETLNDLGWKPCRGEPDVRMRSRTKQNGEKIWEYLLVYTDDLLCIAVNPRAAIEEINKFFTLKPSSIGKPTTYLGAEVSEWIFPDEPDKKYWAMSSEKYVKEAIRNVEAYLDERGLTLRKGATTPIPSNYAPEMDVSVELEDVEATYFMSQISVLRWAVELGRLDIATEVSMLSSHMALPRKGHLDAVYHVYSYLKSHPRSHMVFDANYQQLATREIPAEWKEFYHDAEEKVPADMPEPRGKAVQLIVFVDASHASEKLTRRSRSGILIFLNGAPISWLSKKQNSIETSSFGSEFTAMRLAAELTVAMRFKLRMMGIPLAGPAHVRCDNEAVVKNTSIPESMLAKKHNAVAYHYAREQVAAGVMEVHKEDGKTNLADMLTKVQVGPVRDSMAAKILR